MSARSRTGAAFIKPGSVWENAFVASFDSQVRGCLLATEESYLTEFKPVVGDFCED